MMKKPRKTYRRTFNLKAIRPVQGAETNAHEVVQAFSFAFADIAFHK